MLGPDNVAYRLAKRKTYFPESADPDYWSSLFAGAAALAGGEQIAFALEPDQCGVTVLRSTSKVLPHRITESGRIEPPEHCCEFTCENVQVDDLTDLLRLLERLESDPHACVVRGAVAGETVVDAPRNWLAIDVMPFAIPLTRSPWCISELGRTLALRRLPGEFQRAEAIVQALAFHGGSGLGDDRAKASLRMWIWLDRAITCREARHWLRDCPGAYVAGITPTRRLTTARPVMDEAFRARMLAVMSPICRGLLRARITEDFILQRLCRIGHGRGRVHVPDIVPAPVDRAPFMAALRKISRSGGNEACWNAGYAARELVEAGTVSEDAIVSAIIRAASAAGMKSSEARACARNGLRDLTIIPAKG